jgi:hypothetical protein
VAGASSSKKGRGLTIKESKKENQNQFIIKDLGYAYMLLNLVKGSS